MIRVLSLLVLLSACGDDVTNYQVVENAESQGRQAFSGYFQLDGGSSVNCIYLDEKLPNVVDIESDCQSLVSVNPENGTLGQFPTITASGLLVINNKIELIRDLNYSSGNDIEEDVSGSNVTGRRRTDMIFSFDEDGKLNVEIKVYKNRNNDNLNEVVVERIFKQVD